MTDWELLEQVRRDRSAEAFAELVRRHAAMVYATCRRRLRCDIRISQHVDDVAQAVFLLLWQRPPNQRGDAALCGWLYRTAIYACNNAMRSERIRQRHEREAAEHRASESGPTHRSNEIESQLDDAMSALSTRDRDALLLRFYEDRSVGEVGAALGVSENTATKRLSRALDRLRKVLSRRDVKSDSAMLSVALAGVLRHGGAMPQNFIANVCSATGGGAATSFLTRQITEGVIQMIRQTQLKIAAATFVAAGVLIGGGLTTISLLRGARAETVVAHVDEPTTAPAGAKVLDARTPKAAARTFAKAIRSGDVETMRALAKVEATDEAALLDVACTYMDSSRKLIEALNAKFGAQATQTYMARLQLSPLDTFAGIIETALQSGDLKQDTDSATLIPKGDPDNALYFVRDGELWKVSAAKNIEHWSTEQRAQRRDMMIQLSQTVDQLTEEVQAGRFKSLQEFAIAVKRMMGQGR